MPDSEFDVVILGAGFVGAALAIALSKTGLRVAVVEARAMDVSRGAAEGDRRAIALAWGSRCILESLDCWQALEADAQPLKKIHISDRGHFGAARLNSAEEGVEALGYIVPAAQLGQALYASLDACADIQVWSETRLLDVRSQISSVELDIHHAGQTSTLTTSLLVVADGGGSGLRETLGFDPITHDYGQTAITTTLNVSAPKIGTAFERFSETGPIAMLPFVDGQYGVVWTLQSDQVDEVLALSDADFIARLQTVFGFRLGQFLSVSSRQSYPLFRTEVDCSVRGRVVLTGAAAHSLHPIAGQGLNLGLRDIATLAETIVEAHEAQQDVGGENTLVSYDDWRKRDHRFVSAFTDTLAQMFVNPARPVVSGRNAGLLALDMIPSLRHVLCRRTMGISGRVPRLARGLSLLRN